MGTESSRLDELFDSARFGEWDKCKKMIDQHPELMWTYNPHRNYRHLFVSYLMDQCSYKDENEEKSKDLMRYMKSKAFSMAKTWNEYKEILRKIFESEDDRGYPPIFWAVKSFESFVFFIEECCSSDGVGVDASVDVLAKKDKRGLPLIYNVIVNDFYVESFEYIVEHASNGSDILRTDGWDVIAAVRRGEKDRINARYSFRTYEEDVSKYLKSKRAKVFFLDQEKKYLEKAEEYFDDQDSLVRLVLGVVTQNTDLIRYRECECN